MFMKENFLQRQYITKFMIVVFAVFFIIACSCNRKARCKANCYPLRISGQVINGLTKEPVRGISFEVTWVIHSFINNDKPITKFSSGANGIFDLTVNIDTSLFREGYRIVLTANKTDKYRMEEYIGAMADSIKPATFTDLHYFVYPKSP
jgi:hypothetical protein